MKKLKLLMVAMALCVCTNAQRITTSVLVDDTHTTDTTTTLSREKVSNLVDNFATCLERSGYKYAGHVLRILSATIVIHSDESFASYCHLFLLAELERLEMEKDK